MRDQERVMHHAFQEIDLMIRLLPRFHEIYVRIYPTSLVVSLIDSSSGSRVGSWLFRRLMGWLRWLRNKRLVWRGDRGRGIRLMVQLSQQHLSSWMFPCLALEARGAMMFTQRMKENMSVCATSLNVAYADKRVTSTKNAPWRNNCVIVVTSMSISGRIAHA